MTSIHDHFDLIQKLAAYRTSEEIDAIEDDDLRQEVREQDVEGIRDTLDRIIFQARELNRNRAYDYVDMSGSAIREHYEETDQDGLIEGLSDRDLQDAGEWALNSGTLWDNMHDAWDYGIEMVRSEKQRGERA